uniref:Uncharacterized protein n=1 Tax=viral metagenome TaxID=1070528 RepID=A0A6C0INI2_9ZZZZ
MNKFYEKIILGFLFLIVLYNLVNCNILEGKRRRRRRKRRKRRKQRKPNMKKTNMKNQIMRKRNMIKVFRKKQNVFPKANTNNKDVKQDKEISILNGEIKKINTNLVNTQRITSEKIPSLINHIKSQSEIRLNKIQSQISNNNLKNQQLKSFSEKKGREIQGNIDLLSSDLANNNIKYSDQMTEVNSQLYSLQNKIKSYEENNLNIEEMLKNVNLQLDTKYVNK